MFDGILELGKLKHKPDAIKKLFTNKADSVLANDKFYIIFPERYVNKNLAVMGGTVKLISVYAIVDTNYNYGVISAPVFIDIAPNNITSVLVNGEVNKVLEIEKDHVFVYNRNLIQEESFLYDILDEFFLQGKVPWFMTYDKLSDLFIESRKYAGSKLGDDVLAMEIVASIITRSSEDKLVSYRHAVNKKGKVAKPGYVGLSNVYYSYDNTTAKLMGGYMKQGVTTAIVNREKSTTKVSAVLRA